MDHCCSLLVLQLSTNVTASLLFFFLSSSSVRKDLVGQALPLKD
jgi:hypothetical protein